MGIRWKNMPGSTTGISLPTLGGKSRAFAIEIQNLLELPDPIDPYETMPGFVPPQSYCYIDGLGSIVKFPVVCFSWLPRCIFQDGHLSILLWYKKWWNSKKDYWILVHSTTLHTSALERTGKPAIFCRFAKIRPNTPIFIGGHPTVFQGTISSSMGKRRCRMKTSSCFGGWIRAN